MNQDTKTAEDPKNQEPKHMAWYVVAFLDLLGQQDVLRKMTVLPNVENQGEVAVFKQKVAELYRPLYGLQSFFRTSITPFIEGGLDETAFPPLEQELLKQFRSTPVFYRHFSDSLIVHIPLRNDMGKFQCHAIYRVLAATAMTFLSCLVHSWTIRGGIELGLAMDIEEGEVYGPALARAYRLESKVAQYPRIVIGEELVRYLQMVAGQKAVTAEETAHSSSATRSLGLLAVDDDGCTFLDWLGTDIRSTFQEHAALVRTAYNFIIQESIKHKEDRNSKLGFRYTLLRNYVESRLLDWGIDLKSE
ncbi:MAG: hypothetical protein C0392_14455 [Syntrophus sp. (in: bacteria)]|nr:hypothetical protein [Syntrophus sp. (in: bacteria)]